VSPRLVSASLLIAGGAWLSPAHFTARAAQQPAPNPQKKGATYYSLEAQTGRLTTKFTDGHVVVAQRLATGEVEVAHQDQAGNEIARLRGGRTLDEGTALAHTGEIVELTTEWAEGLTAIARKRTYPKTDLKGNTAKGPAPSRFVQGPAWVAELTLNGTPAGWGVWFIADRVFAYRLTTFNASAYIAPEHFKQQYGELAFTPDATWVNLQTIALHHFKAALLAQQRPIARVESYGQAPRRIVEAIGQFFVPTVHANDVGCDRLHWLDGTVFRLCCDMHDRCYSQNGCNSTSWWRWWSSWTCDQCNEGAITCFEVVLFGCDLQRLSCG
jgi:hypothetical protein